MGHIETLSSSRPLGYFEIMNAVRALMAQMVRNDAVRSTFRGLESQTHIEAENFVRRIWQTPRCDLIESCALIKRFFEAAFSHLKNTKGFPYENFKKRLAALEHPTNWLFARQNVAFIFSETLLWLAHHDSQRIRHSVVSKRL